MAHKYFGEDEFDQQVIKNLDMNEDMIAAMNTPFRAMSAEQMIAAFNIADRVSDERLRIKEDERKKEPKEPWFLQEGIENVKINHQPRKFYD